MEDTGAASRGRAARLPREGRGGRWGGGGRRREGGPGRAAGRRRRAAQGGRRGGPSPALPNGPTSPSKNQVAVKSDQSACPPPRQDRVCVVVPKDFKHGMNTLLWALLNVAKNGERLFIVHVHCHKHISRKGVEKKLGDYVSMCNARKVICDLKIIKNGHYAKALAELIDREGITKLVMRGAADKRYSEEMKSLEFNTAIKLMKTAPLTCKIWFTCNRQLICTREANATVPAIQPPPVDSHALKMAKKKTHTGRASDIKYRQGNIASHTKAKEPSQCSRNERGAKKCLQERKDKEKSYQRDLKNAKKERLRLEKQTEEAEYLKETARNEYFPQETVAAVTEAGGLGEKNDEQSALTLPAETTVNTEFAKDEIEKSKKRLGNTLIGEGGSGSVYKGLLHNTTLVAIKMMHRESMQGESDFNRKVGVLGRVRHPNLVTLMGVCREVFGLVYEFLPNGSLQDRLECRNGMSPLKWQVRIKIIREVWMVLTFLHSSEPPLVHGNLKASKVLLDSSFACKLEAFGISQSNGKSTTQHDVHSFGIIALQLLMGLSPENIAKVVEEAMTKRKLHKILDATAGNWPIAVAEQLALIGLRCVRMSQEERPDLAGDVWKRFVAAASQDEAQAPPPPPPPDHFKCPISKEVMVDPHIAADGHTYEREDISSWFSRGNDTSPVTREMIAHNKLIPNRVVKSMIMDWEEEQQRQQSQVRALTVCDPNPVQNSQGHPIISPGAQSQPPTGLHSDPVTSRSLTPLDTSASSTSSTPTNLIPFLTADARSPTFLPPPTGIRRRHFNGGRPSSSTEADVPGPGETSRIRGKLKIE